MLIQKLKDKYPKLFENSYGGSLGDGWNTLIDALCSHLQFNTDKNNYPQVRVTQLKEKFGGMRFYVEIDGGTSEQCAAIHSVIHFAESYSYRVCETCGTTKNVGLTTGWLLTICKKCFNKEKKTNESFKDRKWKIQNS